jgi:putative FmdB family regulatory protein
MIRLYDFKCIACGHVFERIVRDGERPKCVKCEGQTKKLFPIVNFNIGVPHGGYWDDNLQAGVTSNRQKRELMRKRGVTEKGGTPKPDGEAWV